MESNWSPSLLWHCANLKPFVFDWLFKSSFKIKCIFFLCFLVFQTLNSVSANAHFFFLYSCVDKMKWDWNVSFKLIDAHYSPPAHEHIPFLINILENQMFLRRPYSADFIVSQRISSCLCYFVLLAKFRCFQDEFFHYSIVYSRKLTSNTDGRKHSLFLLSWRICYDACAISLLNMVIDVHLQIHIIICFW